MKPIPLMKKLRLRKGCDYILFIEMGTISTEEARDITDFLTEQGYAISVVLIADIDRIKVVEKL